MLHFLYYTMVHPAHIAMETVLELTKADALVYWKGVLLVGIRFTDRTHAGPHKAELYNAAVQLLQMGLWCPHCRAMLCEPHKYIRNFSACTSPFLPIGQTLADPNMLATSAYLPMLCGRRSGPMPNFLHKTT